MDVRTAIVLDCEYLAIEGSLRRHWCGPLDPDPLVVQIGAAKLALEPDFAIFETRRLYVRPRDRHGEACEVDPYLTGLTGVTNEQVREGLSLADALRELERLAQGAPFWSWGKDELNLLGVSCFVAGIDPPIPAARFDNAARLLLKAGMPRADVETTWSGGLADYYGLEHPPLRSHDALDDALSVACVLQHLLRQGALDASDLAPPHGA